MGSNLHRVSQNPVGDYLTGVCGGDFDYDYAFRGIVETKGSEGFCDLQLISAKSKWSEGAFCVAAKA